jgi:hypothetical protein
MEDKKDLINGNVPQSVIDAVAEYLGEENIRYFKHIRGLKGDINCVLKLNKKKKRHPYTFLFILEKACK